MPFVAAITRSTWIEVLQAHGYDGEVNFWRPGQRAVNPKLIGAPILFVRRGNSPRKVVGYATIRQYTRLSIREAWERWGTRNGVTSLLQFVERVLSMAEGTSANGGGMGNRIEDDQSRIGCLVLSNVSFITDDLAPSVSLILPDFSDRVVSYKIYQGDVPPALFSLAGGAPEVGPNREGRHHDPLKIAAIDQHAMKCVRHAYAGHEVNDVSTAEKANSTLGLTYPGYDLLIRMEGNELHVEVKGTTSESPVVNLTLNELITAARDPKARLAVVSGILTYEEEGTWRTGAGKTIIYSWANLELVRRAIDDLRMLEENGVALRDCRWSLDISRSNFIVRC